MAAGEPSTRGRVSESDYAALAGLRGGLRRYLGWAEQTAREHGLTPAQVQLALAIRSHPRSAGPTLSELAEILQLRHHSVIGLVDRAAESGLVVRVSSKDHAGSVHVQLTERGAIDLEAVSVLHLRWLQEHAEKVACTWDPFRGG